MSALELTVYGKPITQGSKTRTRWGMRDDNGDKLKPWRDNVRSAALDAIGDQPRLEGPVAVRVVFYFDPPRSAPKSRPCWPTTRSSGDVDKLTRAIFDALTDAGVWVDDAQVLDVHATKRHTNVPGALPKPGARITVEPMHDVTPAQPHAQIGA